jgi:Fur family transcriptional regulator, zinc uptake regulator
MERVERACDTAGLRLTEKRRRLLETLLASPSPLSAYELADAYRTAHAEEIAVMSTYRILDAFVGAGIVHKLRSTHRYLPCEHIGASHPHAAAQFLICDTCGAVRETHFGDREIAQLDRKARSSGFTLNHDQLELHGVCSDCAHESD